LGEKYEKGKEKEIIGSNKINIVKQGRIKTKRAKREKKRRFTGRGKNIIFRRGGGINIVFGLK
jgi:hypothetical protein